MNTTPAQAQQSKALEIADQLTAEWQSEALNYDTAIEARNELRRQDALIAELEAQLSAIGAGGVEPLRRRECLAQIQEPAGVEQCQSCRTGSPYACTCTFKTARNSDPSCFEAAPVQMPEPHIYWVEATTQFCIKRGGEVPFASAWEPLYTEHQVRQLLAAHGVK